MRAAYFTELGPADVLRTGDLQTPEAGPGEVRVRIHASGVNPSDVKARLRGRGGAIAFPEIIPHSDGAGVIDSVGPGVDGGLVGRRAWVMNAQYFRAFGTAAEYVVLGQKYVVPMADDVDFAEAACFGIPFLTASHALSLGNTGPGQTVLIQGGAGAVGHHAVQIAKRRGARVLATVSSAEKADYARAAGADAALNYRDEDFVEQLHRLTDGQGADRIIEVNLSANGPLYGQILAPGGMAVIYGTNDPMASLPAMDFIRRGPTLRWFIVYDITDAERGAGVRELNEMLAAGALKTTIAKRFALDDVAAAHRMVEEASHMGNVVVDID